MSFRSREMLSFWLLTSQLFLIPFLCPIAADDRSESEPLPNDYLISTNYGQIQGFPIRFDDGQKTAKIFLGVPFARPPTNERRFEKPVAPKKWSGILNATKMAPSCFPYHRRAMWVEEKDHSEDCLYMNIMAPGWESPDGRPFPVLVNIHGGGYHCGTIRQIREEVVVEKFVRKGIIFVAAQYRTGPLGFAATGDEKFAGNYGLWDQLLALQFIHDNIAKFGGDPQRVTILGFSAGSAIASALSFVPHANGLFQQVIQMSGSMLTEWAVSNRPIFETEKLAWQVGCRALADSAELKKCLKGKSVHELLDAVDRMGQSRRDLNTLMFTPRLDADFFPDDPTYLIEKAAPKKTLIGLAEKEALTFTLLGADSSVQAIYVPPEKWENFSRADVEQFVEEIVAPEKAFVREEAAEVQKRIVDFYLKDGEHDNAYYLQKYTEIVSDTMFLVPSQLEATQKAALGWPVYLYMIDHVYRHSYPPEVPVEGAYHAVELPALYDIRFFPFAIKQSDAEDSAFEKLLLRSITNFVRTGNPSSALLDWAPLDSKFPLRYALLNGKPDPEVKKALWPEKLEFWQKLKKQFSFDIVRGVQKTTLRSKDEL